MKHWRSAAIGLLAMTACGEARTEAPVPAPAPVVEAPPQPALWKISDADTTVYFFGTVHVLPPELDWHSPPVTRALDMAKAIYFETDTEGDPIAFREMIDRLGKFEPSDRLANHLTKSERASLEAAAGKLNMPFVVLDTMRPWYAGVVIAEAVVRNAGYDASSGVENVLRPEARRDGKEIRFLESVEDQMASFATLPQDIQVKFLVEGLQDIDSAKKGLGELVNAWKTGNLDDLKRVLIDDDMARIPALYDALLTHRNAAWTTEVDTLMQEESGTFLIAVGTAHLIGKDSVLEMLKPLGYTAERIQ
ncbi:MAG: TraB/GumN family protein [Hyphomonadaceae bacterium]